MSKYLGKVVDTRTLCLEAKLLKLAHNVPLRPLIMEWNKVSCIDLFFLERWIDTVLCLKWIDGQDTAVD